MSQKSVYLYKVVISETATKATVPVSAYKALFQNIIDRESKNHAIKLTHDMEHVEPMTLDILENTEEYLFARLSKKRPNNSMQKRDYSSNLTYEVLQPDEIADNGVEWFTYCILGYSHGIVSIANSKGAPRVSALAKLFALYDDKHYLETEAIPNTELYKELISGQAPEVNKFQVQMACPDAQLLQELLRFTDEEVLHEVQSNAANLVFEVRPQYRKALTKNRDIIKRFINSFRSSRPRYNSVTVTGKKSPSDRQQKYDLFDEYFKYTVNIDEYYQQNGQQIEKPKGEILREYLTEMKRIYDENRVFIVAVSNPAN